MFALLFILISRESGDEAPAATREGKQRRRGIDEARAAAAGERKEERDCSRHPWEQDERTRGGEERKKGKRGRRP